MSDVEILSRRVINGYYRYEGAYRGEKIRDSVNIPVAEIEARTEQQATDLVKRQLRTLSRYLADNDGGSIEAR